MTVEGHLGATSFRCNALVRNRVLTEGQLIFSGVEVAVDLGLVALVGEALNVLTDLSLGRGGTTKEMLEVQLDKAVRSVAFEEATAVLRRERNGSNKFTGAGDALGELAFCREVALTLHQVGLPITWR